MCPTLLAVLEMREVEAVMFFPDGTSYPRIQGSWLQGLSPGCGDIYFHRKKKKNTRFRD